jgi:hypothetical protein
MNLYHNNSKSEICNFLPKKNNKCFERSLSRNILIKKVLCKKNTEICKQNLHKILMELELNKN